ncbi:hypothetical protein ACFP2T_18715 [Plantactinospora solaniradicis]|uniref:Twin-arginine translocation signal domain-containing protein n=1 Tax=Plantactinospora solaniradicis TaxID=1723736 RepID=A0ABW1KBR8_9ACTN
MTSIDQKNYWDDIPLNDPEAESTRLGGRSLKGTAGYATFKLPRRSLLKTVGVLSTALAVTVVSSIPEKLLPKALATVGSQYTDCNIYSYNDIVCVGAPYARSYCGTDGWFLNYSSASFNSWPITACNSRNAWWWWHVNTTYRCADGRQQVSGQSSVFRICMWAL